MQLYNIKNSQEQVTFKEAVKRGLAAQGGLYFPEKLPYFEDMEALLSQDFITRSITIVQALIGDEFSSTSIERMVTAAFHFPIRVQPVTERIFALELFLGPTLAFKDFGARFMAQLLLEINKETPQPKPTMILTATSGDTGAAVAHAFHGLPGIQVVILYPHQRISELQEKLFCTLGGNVHTLAIEGDFDDCQALVKQCFEDPAITERVQLNSANSINVSRIFAQSLYYFEAAAQLRSLYPQGDCPMICVPSGNFGNLTAGLFAQRMGLPVSTFVAATNVNDTVPRYLKTGQWEPKETIATLANAMDVSRPNNWPRIEELMANTEGKTYNPLRGVSISEGETESAMRELKALGYIADPHSAIGYAGLKACLGEKEKGIFLCTAHPAKFKKSVEHILGITLPMPKALEMVVHKPILSQVVPNSYQEVRKRLLDLS